MGLFVARDAVISLARLVYVWGGCHPAKLYRIKTSNGSAVLRPAEVPIREIERPNPGTRAALARWCHVMCHVTFQRTRARTEGHPHTAREGERWRERERERFVSPTFGQHRSNPTQRVPWLGTHGSAACAVLLSRLLIILATCESFTLMCRTPARFLFVICQIPMTQMHPSLLKSRLFPHLFRSTTGCGHHVEG